MGNIQSSMIVSSYSWYFLDHSLRHHLWARSTRTSMQCSSKFVKRSFGQNFFQVVLSSNSYLVYHWLLGAHLNYLSKSKNFSSETGQLDMTWNTIFVIKFFSIVRYRILKKRNVLKTIELWGMGGTALKNLIFDGPAQPTLFFTTYSSNKWKKNTSLMLLYHGIKSCTNPFRVNAKNNLRN